MNKRIGELILQIIPVMIGVYLGFVVSNWTDSHKVEVQKDLLNNNLIAEIQANKNKVQEVLEYHKILRDSSGYYLTNNVFNKKPDFFTGVRTFSLTNSAFETGIQTGLINELTFNKIQAVSNVYTLQDSYNDFARLLLSGLLTLDFTENEEGLKKFYRFISISMSDVVIMESQLLKEYDILLEQLKRG